MKVKTLIELLSRENPEAQVYLHDPDTSGIIPLRYGLHGDTMMMGSKHGGYDLPEGGVAVHATYSDWERPAEDIEK